MDRTAALVVIGDEILSGKFADENAPFAIGLLRGWGVRLRRIEVIPDDPDAIAAAVSTASGRYDAVVTSGGVGPTHDDVTMAGIARGFGVAVVEHPGILALLRRYYGDALTPAQRRLAEVPDGAELVDVPGNPAPVVAVRNVYVLPGVPSLFRKKLAALEPRLRGTPFHVGRLVLAVDETEIAERLTAAAAAHPDVAFGSYPRFDEEPVHLILTIEGKDPAAVARALADLADTLGALVTRIEHA
jgi:molybdenum cofactor synthesis domain-containing protein